MRIDLICVLISFCVFAVVIAIGVLHDKYSKRENVREKREGEWLFTDWGTKIYYAFTNKKPEVIAKKLGINVEKYLHDCYLTKKRSRLEDVVTKKILGVVCSLVFLVIGAVTKNAVIALMGLVGGFTLSIMPTYTPDKAAQDRRVLILEEMSRFMDLLQTALYINLPIEEAIVVTAKHLKGTVIAEEFMGVVADTQLGAYDWQEALEKMAQKFGIEAFSDFVLDLTTSYNKGLNIYDVVVRENKDIKKTNLLTTKERASKLNSKILAPITIFKLIPLLILFCVPIIIQLKSSGF